MSTANATLCSYTALYISTYVLKATLFVFVVINYLRALCVISYFSDGSTCKHMLWSCIQMQHIFQEAFHIFKKLKKHSMFLEALHIFRKLKKHSIFFRKLKKHSILLGSKRSTPYC